MANVLIAPRVDLLNLKMDPFGAPISLHPTLCWDNEDVVLVDAGFPGQLKQLREEVERAGFSLERLTRLILTHQDIDHIGGASALLVLNDRIEVLAHEQERPYVAGEKRLVKISPERMAQLAERLTTPIDAFTNARARVDRTLADGERISYCGGIVVIHTPGHTVGHISLYLEASRVLVAGDALNVVDGRLVGPNPRLTPELDQATSSLTKLAPYDIETVVCYHGGLYSGDVNARIAELADEAKPGN